MPLLLLALVGVLTHLAGNVPFIWAMGVVGIAITVPASLGVNLVGCAVLGQWLLKERVSPQSIGAIAALVLSVAVLSLGAGQANSVMNAKATGAWWAFVGVAASCLAGMVFAVLNIAIRRSATRGVNLAAIGFLVPAMGAVSLAPICLAHVGWSAMLATPARDVVLMLVCGTLNIASYLAIIKGIEATTVVHANVLGATQIAMAAVAGLLFFGEALSPGLLVGVALTLAGTLLIGKPAA
jgi:drug/metabolite transporter (DMT)-like permease